MRRGAREVAQDAERPRSPSSSRPLSSFENLHFALAQSGGVAGEPSHPGPGTVGRLASEISLSTLNFKDAIVFS